MKMRTHAALLSIFALVMLAVCLPASATVINLASSGVTGTGCCFASAGNAESVTVVAGGYEVVLNGGTPLGPNISFLPATSSVAYGTNDNYTSGETGYTNPLTIQFFNATTLAPENVTNFFLSLYNGNTVNVNYTLEDNLGNGETFNIGSNTASGQQVFGFASAGNSFTITAGAAPGGCCGWDFFIDNIGFNQALPPGSTNGGSPIGAPEPNAASMMLIGLAGLGLAGYRKIA